MNSETRLQEINRRLNKLFAAEETSWPLFCLLLLIAVVWLVARFFTGHLGAVEYFCTICAAGLITGTHFLILFIVKKTSEKLRDEKRQVVDLLYG